MVKKFRASPLSNVAICDIAQQFRKMLGVKPDAPIDILKVLEIAMPILDTDFNYSVREKEDMEVDAHAYTDPDNSEIVILNDIYDRAVEGRGRDRMTIAHEIGHYLLHNKQMCVLTRVFDGESVKTYEDPEWQADAFAGEFLCPAAATSGLTIDEIVAKFGVSTVAAKNQKRKGGE
ncbi:MAG: ImmA/IrrE family metallo-endopeptidase [Clostridia bacterium]|nr:ImmA/IrrE family metallo-endopeptidase [Clostridia bacterium]